MPTVKQVESHEWVLAQLKKAQTSEKDMRDQARESHIFVDAVNGQWEQYWYDLNDGKPRYQFDKLNPIIDIISGDMKKRDFDIKISPSGGDASKDTAKTYNGMVRNIENLSGAHSVYNRAGKEMVTCGLDGWRIDQDYVSDDSFDQDLLIKKVANYLDRVWHGPHEEPDASDAKMCWVLTGIEKEEYKAKYPDRPENSLSADRTANAYYHRADLVMVGEFLYIKETERELVLMDNGKVYEDDKGFKQVADELAALGVTEMRRRKRKSKEVYTRLFDNKGWIGEPRKTVFENWIPVVPCYANFKVFEDKVIYWGAVAKAMDSQRVYNYSQSREIEEGALAPRAKTWMTQAMSEGFEDSLATMNTNADPVQFFNADPDLPGYVPVQTGGSQINPGLRTISESMKTNINEAAGMFAASMGDNPNLQSGVAIDSLIDQSSTGNNKYIEARELSQAHTARILVNAIPRVYKQGRQVRLIGEDGSLEMTLLGEQVQDQQTGEMVMLNDLNVGTYDVTVTSGPSFKNRQGETVTAITELGKIDPSVIGMGKDILLANINSPGMDVIAERARKQLFEGGQIPDEQLTKEEQALRAQMAQQPPQQDPMAMAAAAEMKKAESDMVDSQTRQMNAQTDQFNAETKRMEAEIKAAEARAEIGLKGSKKEGEDLSNMGVMQDMQEKQNQMLQLLQGLPQG